MCFFFPAYCQLYFLLILDDGREMHSLLQICSIVYDRLKLKSELQYAIAQWFLLCSPVIAARQSLAMIGLGLFFPVKRKIFKESENLSQIWNSYFESDFHL